MKMNVWKSIMNTVVAAKKQGVSEDMVRKALECFYGIRINKVY